MKTSLIRLIAIGGVIIMLAGIFGCNTVEPPAVPTEAPATEAPGTAPVPDDTEGPADTEAPEDTAEAPTGDVQNTEEPTEDVQNTEEPTAAPTDAPTAAPTEAPTAAPTEAPTETPAAGYKKYFTMSFDDGITQDARVIEILKKYNMPCTFNINTGLYGTDWSGWLSDYAGKPVSHVRFTKVQLQSGIYKGFDVEVHTLTHPDLADNYVKYGKNNVVNEVKKDAENIAAITGVKPAGMAYPGGLESNTSDEVIRAILENTNVRFARLAVNAKRPSKFEFPEYWMMWYPTVAMGNGFSNVNKYAERFIAAEATDRDLLFYAWGHAYEFDLNDSWDDFEAFVKMMSEQKDIVFVTNAELYELFKDKIPSWKD